VPLLPARSVQGMLKVRTVLADRVRCLGHVNLFPMCLCTHGSTTYPTVYNPNHPAMKSMIHLGRRHLRVSAR
jgi:hypothetical protein